MIPNSDPNDQQAAAVGTAGTIVESAPDTANLPVSDPAMPAVGVAPEAADPIASTADPELNHDGNQGTQPGLAASDLATSQLPAGQDMADDPAPQLTGAAAPLVTDPAKEQALEATAATGPHKVGVSAAAAPAVNNNPALPAKGTRKRVSTLQRTISLLL